MGLSIIVLPNFLPCSHPDAPCCREGIMLLAAVGEGLGKLEGEAITTLHLTELP